MDRIRIGYPAGYSRFNCIRIGFGYWFLKKNRSGQDQDICLISTTKFHWEWINMSQMMVLVRDERTVNFFISSPVLIRKIFENHQSDPVLIRQYKIMCFYFASWGKRTTKVFCLQTNTIGWSQNISSSAFASWCKMDTAFWHFQNLTRKCLLGIRGKSTAGVILPLGESDCLD